MLSAPKIAITLLLIGAALLALKLLGNRARTRSRAVEEAARKATRAGVTDLTACPRCGTHTAAPCTDPKCPL